MTELSAGRRGTLTTMGDTKTDPTLFDDDDDEGHPTGAQLFKLLECDNPLAPSARYALVDLDQAILGRGRVHFTHRFVDGGSHILRVEVPDTWTSTQHARVVGTRDGWVLEDLNSKNGTVLNGTRCTRANLGDGDIFEIGHVMFLFRELGEGEGDVTADRLPAPTPELATFVDSLAAKFELVAKLARNPVASLTLYGETGTGKEVVARAFHELSGRAGPFVAVNCGALSSHLFEAELFGFRRGSFTGAQEDRPGLVRASDRGTLFLDEIGELSPHAQTALLRVLQEKEVLPIGAVQPVKIDLQVISATNRDLAELVRAGSFRRDLLARVAGLRISLPSLRERREDLGLLVSSILRRTLPGTPPPALSLRAARALLQHEWPMNIRQLENAIATAAALSDGQVIHLRMLPEPLELSQAKPKAAAVFAPDNTDAQRRTLIRLLEEHRGNVAHVARSLGKAPMQVYRWMRRHGLTATPYRR